MMQPYQAADAEAKRQSEFPIKAAGSLGAAALGGAGVAKGASLLGKAGAFLSKYIPEDLAIKGLSKLDPRFGKFIKKSLSEGYDFDEVKDFIGSKIEESRQEPKENRNIIQQYSPELHQFVDQEIKKGRSPIEAGAIAQNDKRFSSVINKITKDHKSPWSSILQSIYGQGVPQVAQQQQSQPISQGEPQQAQQPGQGQAALMAILQKLKQSRGGG